MSSRTSQASSSEKTCDAVGARLGARLGAGLDAFLALDAEADQRADLAAELDRLLLGQVAEVLDLDLALGVLVDGQCVDHAHRVALTQPLELGDDLAVEVGVLEAEHDQLNWSNRHLFLSFDGSAGVLRRSHERRSIDNTAHRPVRVRSSTPFATWRTGMSGGRQRRISPQGR